MKAFLYGWIQDIAFYTLLMVVVLHVLPEKNQRKYLQFFMGVVLIILVMSPILQFTGLEQRLDETYAYHTYDRELQEFLRRQEEIEAEYQARVETELERAHQEQEKAQQELEEEAATEQEETQSGIRTGVERIRIEIEPLEED